MDDDMQEESRALQVVRKNATPEQAEARTHILQEELHHQCETLLIFIEVRFPDLLPLAQERLLLIQTTKNMYKLFLYIGLSENQHDAEMHLLNIKAHP